MDNHILSRATKYLSKQRKRARWHKIISILAAIVVFGTTYALILPAITMEKTLVCEEEEHTHTDACYTEQKVLVCQQEEGTEHTHTDECYQTEKVLACGKAEHTHTEECYKKVEGDPDADVETQSDWEDTIKQVELTGDWSEDVLAIANSQIGYKESATNYVEEDGEIRGYSRYGEWYGDPYGKWSGMFVSFCLNYAKVDNIPLQSDCNQWVADLQKEEYALYREADQYTPAPGDLIFFHMDTSDDSAYQEIADHVGLVVEVTSATGSTPAKIKTIEGDSDDLVQNVVYDLTDARILGYGQLPEEPKEAVADTSNDEESSDSANEAQQGDEAAADSADTVDENGDGKEAESEEDELSEEEQAMIDEVIAKIDALPSSQEIEDTLATYEEDGLDDEYEAYYEEVSLRVKGAYNQYQAISEKLQKKVTNRDKLLDLEWIWGVMPFTVTNTVSVNAVNNFSWNAGAIIVHGDNGLAVRDSGMSHVEFLNWYALRIEYESGRYVVKQKEPADGTTSKRDVWASGTGFVLLYHEGNLGVDINVNVGDTVTVSGDFWKTTHNYNNGQVYGTVTFSTPSAELKPDKDNSSQLTIVPGADTRDLIEVNLYDYGTNINELYNGNKNYPGFQQDKGSTSVGNAFNKYSSFNFGNNITSDLAAGLSGVTNAGGDINKTTNGANSPISGAMKSTLGNDGQPALADGTSLGYLFSNSDYATKKNSQSINGLFQYNDTTGAYTFNSRENHAQFNSSNDTFTLYDQMISSNFMMYPFGNFLPFNDIVKQCKQTSTIDRAYLQTIADSAQYKYGQGQGNEYGTLATQLKQFISLMDDAYGTDWEAADAMNEYFKASGIPRTFTQDEELLKKIYSIDYDEPTDFFFGMEMEMNFMQPKGGLTGKDGKQPMIFYFTGDDDVWVYIDGQMFLDLSGIHRHVGGEIDFVKGVVNYYDLDVNTGDVSTTPKTVSFAEILGSNDGLNGNGTFEDYSTHTFKFYYMERGAGSGVCRMNFNFPLLRKNSISVTKELSVDESDKLDMLGNPDFRFQVLKGNGTDLFIGENVSYDIYDSNNKKIGSGTTGKDGVFTIKAGQTAVFKDIDENSGSYFVRELLDLDAFAQYGTISVDGSSVTTDYDVTIGSDTFKGIDSPIKDMSNGSTSFTFNNQVIFNKLGSLEIEKKVEGETSTDQTFRFRVTLDGNPLAVGTSYTVGGDTRRVTQEGIIELSSGETAHISNIIAGCKFEIEETEDSSNGYALTYSGSGITTDGRKASGVIKTETPVKVIATNTLKATSITIPGTKNLEHPDGLDHTYTFQLEQVTDSNGDTCVDGGTSLESTATFAGNTTSSSFEFTIAYREKDMDVLPATYYYKITESENTNDFATEFDETVYVVEVMVDKDENGNLRATLMSIRKNQKALTDETSIIFNNRQLYSLVIQKQVEGSVDSEQEFQFEVSLTDGDVPLTGTFPSVKTLVDRTTESNQLTFEDGKVSITLKDGESIQINGLPYGVNWNVKEVGVDGYLTKYTVCDGTREDGSEAKGILQDGNNNVKFINIITYELPESGGSGTIWYTIGGLILMLGAFLMYRRIRMRKGGESSAD